MTTTTATPTEKLKKASLATHAFLSITKEDDDDDDDDDNVNICRQVSSLDQ